MFNITSVPDRRWETVKFDVLLDHTEVMPQEFDVQVLVKTPDELQELREATIAEIEAELDAMKRRADESAASSKKAVLPVKIKPSQGADVRLARALIVDWKRVTVSGSNGKEVPLEFSEENFLRVVHCVEARVALVKTVAKACNREDLITGNS